MEGHATQSAGSVRGTRVGADGLELQLSGRLDSANTGGVWRRALELLEAAPPASLRVDATDVEYCDGSGVALLWELRHRQEDRGGQFELVGLEADFRRLLNRFKSQPSVPRGTPPTAGFVRRVGKAAGARWRDVRELIAFTGELTLTLGSAILRPRSIRARDALLVAEKAGVDALPIVGIVSFLIGLIMAFQSAVPMRTFGVEIFVADLVGLSMLRELGPLMTAIVLAGRSGSAFAAELGTMKVNEEIDALTTMGLDPVRFLVTTRVLAAVIVTPILTVFANFLGLLGGLVVFLSLGFPMVTYFNQVDSAVGMTDFMSGLVKAFAFGILVAGIGCLRGLQTGKGASAVGSSTTSAVVSGIVLICVTDSVFSVVYYALGI